MKKGGLQIDVDSIEAQHKTTQSPADDDTFGNADMIESIMDTASPVAEPQC